MSSDGAPRSARLLETRPVPLPGRLRAGLGATLCQVALAAWLLVLTPDAEAHSGPCERIRVDIRDRGELLNSYTVGDPEYVARKHDEIDRNGQDGVWTVAAGELGSLEYTVTYTCLARSGSD